MYVNTYIIYKQKRKWEQVEKARKADKQHQRVILLQLADF